MASRISIATIRDPEFINLEPLDLNPGMSKCEIKVLYLGQNPNHTFIDKETATDMAKTLRGAPIVGWFRDSKDDFFDHGERVIIDGDGIKIKSKTRPYGFVSPDAKVWFQEFEDEDKMGNKFIRTYLMTTGYIWTEVYEESKRIIEEGRPQSMELDEDTLEGRWTTDMKTNIEFFIINDATFTKLCVLGEDIEPCFHGASITAPEVSKNYTAIDNNFKNTLYTMMEQLKQFVKEGGEQVEENKNTTEFSKEEDKKDKDKKEETSTTEFVKDKEEKKEEEKKEEQQPPQEEDEKKKDKYALLEKQFNDLSEKYSSLASQYENLVAFKETVENQKKDELINQFYMLSDDDKKDVIEHKSKYSLDEIESKLSVICVRKKVNFNLNESDKNDSKKEQEDPVVTYNMKTGEDSAPAWIMALRNKKNSLNN